MGFDSKWMQWIWWCISTTRFYVLVNGVLGRFFPSSRGLRQGDPLSSYLFIIGMEDLCILLRKAGAGGFIIGRSISDREGASLRG